MVRAKRGALQRVALVRVECALKLRANSLALNDKVIKQHTRTPKLTDLSQLLHCTLFQRVFHLALQHADTTCFLQVVAAFGRQLALSLGRILYQANTPIFDKPLLTLQAI